MVLYVAACIASLLIIAWCLYGILRFEPAIDRATYRKKAFTRSIILTLVFAFHPLINVVAAKSEPIPNSVRIALAEVGIGKTIREVEVELGPLEGPFPGSLAGTQEWRFDFTPDWSLIHRKYAAYTVRDGRVIMSSVHD